jgi:GT2 family glycosyltransferase
MNVTAILACHNRRARTLQCLASYYAQEVEPAVSLSAVLVDDGSVDGTAQAVRQRFPGTQVIVGSGDLFWAGAMAVAERAALDQDPDYLMWLNDDVVLDRDALSRLIHTAGRGADDRIAVGGMRDPSTGELTYSGVRRRGLHPLRVNRVVPADEPVEVETFNGNAVLVPRGARRKVGPIDGALVHAAADFDYGLRAAEAGVSRFLAPGTVGTCPRDPGPDIWADRSIPVRQRLGRVLGPKGLAPQPRARYLKRHAGPAWFIFWLTSYVRAAPSILWPPRSKGG